MAEPVSACSGRSAGTAPMIYARRSNDVRWGSLSSRRGIEIGDLDGAE